MDLLFKRYASPFLLLDQLIENDELSGFINVLWDNIQEEQQWDYFLAKVYDKSFNEFKDSMKPQAPISKKQLEATVNESWTIMENFNPEGS